MEERRTPFQNSMLLEDPKQWAAVGISLVTSTIVFLRRVLMLNQFKRKVASLDAVAYMLQLESGVLFWITLHAIQDELYLQILAGGSTTFVSWCSFILLINRNFCLPTRQQWASLFFFLCTELAVSMQARLILGSF